MVMFDEAWGVQKRIRPLEAMEGNSESLLPELLRFVQGTEP